MSDLNSDDEAPIAAEGVCRNVDEKTLLTTPRPVAASTIARDTPNERYNFW